MGILKRIMTTVLAICLLPVLAAAAAEPAAQTLPPRIEAVYDMGILPGSWSPLSEQTPEKQLILELTADRLYRLSADGSRITPSLAAAMPADVTTAFAGQYGVPADAIRGYAYRIELTPDACWDDGRKITAGDWYFTLRTMLDFGKLELDIANAENYLQGLRRGTAEVISLMDAGFESVAQAREAGHREFFVDTTWFWGLDSGWKSITDRTRLKDEAIPSGCDEMYVSGAYLYDKYLGDQGLQNYFQSEFVGVRSAPGEPMTLEDVGIIREDRGIILIMAEPVTSGALALELGELILLREDLFGADYATSADTYSSTGPYRVVSVTGSEIRLEPNENWQGSMPVFEADAIRFLANG